MRLVLASRNPKKCEELLALLAPLGIEVVPVSAFPHVPSVEETGTTFEANATLKAEHARDWTDLAAVADDSGLVVDALGGEPGVRSARFAGEHANDAANNRRLLDRLSGVLDAERTARFVCVLAMARPHAETQLFRGETRGRITHNPIGENGFGYDPLFLSDELHQTFAQVNAAQKHRISHRGRALQKLAAYCKDPGAIGR